MGGWGMKDLMPGSGGDPDPRAKYLVAVVTTIAWTGPFPGQTLLCYNDTFPILKYHGIKVLPSKSRALQEAT